MTRFERPEHEESCENFARLWFDGLTRFHRIDNAAFDLVSESRAKVVNAKAGAAAGEVAGGAGERETQ